MSFRCTLFYNSRRGLFYRRDLLIFDAWKGSPLTGDQISPFHHGKRCHIVNLLGAQMHLNNTLLLGLQPALSPADGFRSLSLLFFLSKLYSLTPRYARLLVLRTAVRYGVQYAELGPSDQLFLRFKNSYRSYLHTHLLLWVVPTCVHNTCITHINVPTYT